MTNLAGIIPAIVTPLDDKERFRPLAFERLIDHLYSAGVHGLYVCGQTGEGLQLSSDERREAAEVAVRKSPPGKAVIVHVGAASEKEALALASHASHAGAAAISSLPPTGAYSFREIRDYYSALASTSEAPLILYYFPSVPNWTWSTDQLLELCALPNVIGVKFTDSNMFKLWELRQAGVKVYNGSDEMLIAGLIMGANGGIGSTYNLIPESFTSLYSLTVQGRWEEARQLQDEINEFVAALLRFPVHAAIKAALRWIGFDCGNCFKPRRTLDPSEENDLQTRLLMTSIGRQLLSAAVA